tara:strand:- start:5646 stop:6068 length:423 start_codon:yes stop_codon:yes gene_type:complete
MKKIFYIISLSIVSIGCSYTGNDTIINGTELNIVLLEVPSEPDTISEDMRYANFELEVPEITEEIYDNASINAYIKRTYEDDTPDRWSQLPQVFLNSNSSTSAYLSFGEGFIRISFQSEESVEELYDLFAGRTLKLVIVN